MLQLQFIPIQIELKRQWQRPTTNDPPTTNHLPFVLMRLILNQHPNWQKPSCRKYAATTTFYIKYVITYYILKSFCFNENNVRPFIFTSSFFLKHPSFYLTFIFYILSLFFYYYLFNKYYKYLMNASANTFRILEY